MKRRIIPYRLLLLLSAGLLSWPGTGLFTQEISTIIPGPMIFPGGEDTFLCMRPGAEGGSFQATFQWKGNHPGEPVLMDIYGHSLAGEMRINGILIGEDSLAVRAADSLSLPWEKALPCPSPEK